MNGDAVVSGTTGDLILAGSVFSGSLSVSGNQSADVTIPSGETRDYAVALVGNTIGKNLACADNDPGSPTSARRTRCSARRPASAQGSDALALKTKRWAA